MNVIAEIVESLQSCTDEQLHGVVMALCAERPVLHEQLMATLSQPSLSRHTGVIKAFTAAKGFGFIECPEVHAEYGRDVFLHEKQKGCFEVGTTVTFTVTLNKQGQPQAQDLAPADPAALAVAVQAGGGGGGGGGTKRSAAAAATQYNWDPQEYLKAAEAASRGRHLGRVKWYDAAKRFGFIQSPTIMAQYGRDAFVSEMQIGPFTQGSLVSFRVSNNQHGHPQAQDLEDAGELTDGDGNPAAEPGSLEALALAAGLGEDMPWPGEELNVPPAKRPRQDAGDASGDPARQAAGGSVEGFSQSERFVGVIKKFSAEKHFGFIDCPELHQLFGADVYLSDKQIGPFENGNTVSFHINVKNGKPQAYNLDTA